MNDKIKKILYSIFIISFSFFCIFGCKTTTTLTNGDTGAIFSVAMYSGELRNVIRELDDSTRNAEIELQRVKKEFDEESRLITEQIERGINASEVLTNQLKLAIRINQRIINTFNEYVNRINNCQSKIEATTQHFNDDSFNVSSGNTSTNSSNNFKN